MGLGSIPGQGTINKTLQAMSCGQKKKKIYYKTILCAWGPCQWSSNRAKLTREHQEKPRSDLLLVISPALTEAGRGGLGWALPADSTPRTPGCKSKKGSPQPEGLEGQKEWELTSCSGLKPGLSFVSGLSVSIFTSTTCCDVTASVSITSSPSSWARRPTSTAKK